MLTAPLYYSNSFLHEVQDVFAKTTTVLFSSDAQAPAVPRKKLFPVKFHLP